MQDRVTIATLDHVDLECDLAGLGSRFAAYLVDMLVIFLLFLGLFVLLLVLGGAVSPAVFTGAVGEEKRLVSWLIAGIMVLFFLLQWGYFLFFELLLRGQTPGKKALGIRVLRDDGLPITLRQATLRNLMRVADMLPPPSYLLAGIVMYYDRHGRRLGDMVAGTLVVRERPLFQTASPGTWSATWMARLESGKAPHLTLPHGSISAAQLGLIDQFMQRRHTLPPARRHTLATHILAPLRPMLGEGWQGSADEPERLLDKILSLAHEPANTSVPNVNGLGGELAKQRQWQQFLHQAQQLLRGGRGALRALSAAALHTFISDYHRLTTDLARARSLGAAPQTLNALNRLVLLGHRVLYGYVKGPTRLELYGWYTAFPRAVRQHRWAVALSACWLFGPAVISYVALQWHPELAYDMVAEEFLDFMPSDTQHLHSIPSLLQPIAASRIITNNVQVALLAFGLGLTAGVGTCVVLVFNGMHLGAVAGWLTRQGYSRALWGWIMPHGGTELLAIVLSGAAGLVLARALLAPGEPQRSMALRRVAPSALYIVLGSLVMLAVAGLIEGFVSPSPVTYPMRLAVLLVSLCAWLTYLLYAGRGNTATV